MEIVQNLEILKKIVCNNKLTKQLRQKKKIIMKKKKMKN